MPSETMLEVLCDCEVYCEAPETCIATRCRKCATFEDCSASKLDALPADAADQIVKLRGLLMELTQPCDCDEGGMERCDACKLLKGK